MRRAMDSQLRDLNRLPGLCQMPAVVEKCPKCFGRGVACLCAQVRPVSTSTRFVVLRHILEVPKQSNTARIAALALTNCELRTYAEPGVSLRTEDLTLPGTWLLFAEGGAPTFSGPRPERLVVLDGSWSQVRHMLQRLEGLRGLPRLSLPPPADRRSLRRSPPGGMSTLEAVARAVELLEGPGAGEPLEVLHRAMLARVLQTRGYV